MPEQRIVKGRITRLDGSPLAGAKIQVFDKDLRSEELLGEAVTDGEGAFEISYTAEQFRRAEKKSADLVFRVYERAEEPLRIVKITVDGLAVDFSHAIFNAPAEVRVDLVVEPSRELSEYERLMADLTPVLEDVPLAETTDEDLSFLVGETGIEQKLIDLLRAAAQLARETGLPPEPFYGWARNEPPLPRNWQKVPETAADARDPLLNTILDQLVATAAAELRAVLLKAIDRKVIPNVLGERVDDIVRALKRRGLTVHQASGLLVDSDSGVTVPELTGLTVRMFDLDSGEPPDDLGLDVTDGLGRFTITYLLPTDAAPETERKLRFHILDSEAKELLKTEIRLKANEQKAIEIRVPIAKEPEPAAHVLSELVDTTRLKVPAALRSFLDKHGIRSLGDIRRSGGIGQLKGLPVASDHAAVRALEAHADLSHLSPDVRVNASLIDRGYTSIAAVARTPRAIFVSEMHDQMGDFKAAQLQVMSRAWVQFLDNILAGEAAERANRYDLPPTRESSRLYRGDEK